MAWDPIGDLLVFTFPSLRRPDLQHAVFTRRGGVSPAPWASLNLGGTVGDDRARVRENLRRALQAARRSPDSLHEVWQVHSADVVHAREPRGQEPLARADAMITQNPQVTLLMRFADCVPILLYDPVRQAIGLAHAGWLGTVRHTASQVVRAMREAFGTRAADLLAALGPSIGPDHYVVGEDVVQAVRQAFGPQAEELLRQQNGRIHFDLWLANRRLLETEGVESIEVAGLCTACHLEDWYSHRAERGQTGRFGALLALAA